MTTASSDLVRDLAPTGVLRASINLGNPVLAQGTPDAPPASPSTSRGRWRSGSASRWSSPASTRPASRSRR